jgi:hypothetical protein
VPLPEEEPLLEVPVPEDPVLDVPLPEDPLLDVPLPEVPVLEVPLLEPVLEAPPLEPLWVGTKGMVPPPHPTREIIANTKTHVLSIEISFKSGIGTNPLWPDDYGAEFRRTERLLSALRFDCGRSAAAKYTLAAAARSILPRTKTKTTPVLHLRTKGTWLNRNCRGKRLRQGLPNPHQEPGQVRDLKL